MSFYLLCKLLHILSSTVLFGTGLGSAFYMWQAHRSDDMQLLARVAGSVVLADWIFTTPAVIAQPVTGVAMVLQGGFGWHASWLQLALALYVLIGCCWLPVVFLQIQVRDMAVAAAGSGEAPDPRLEKYMRYWYALGWPAFLGVIVIFALMVFKPVLW
jgi:uncharacterized membrane protein